MTAAAEPRTGVDPSHPLARIANVPPLTFNSSYTVGIYSAAHRIIVVAHDPGDALTDQVKIRRSARAAIDALQARSERNPRDASIYTSYRYGFNVSISRLIPFLLIPAFLTVLGAFIAKTALPSVDYPALPVLVGLCTAIATILASRRFAIIRQTMKDAEDQIARSIAAVSQEPYRAPQQLQIDNRHLTIVPLPPLPDLE